MDALVTDVHLPSAVAGLRGLGRAGHRVVALGDHWSAGGLWSRHTVRRAVGPTAEAGPAFTATVAALAADHGPVVVYAGWEGSLSALFEPPGLPAGAVSPYPATDPAVLRRMCDKRELSGLASAAGLRVPATLAAGTAQELAGLRLPFPCVVKPVVGGGRPATACVVESLAALDVLLAGADPGAQLLVQPRAAGPLLMLALVMDRDRRPVAAFQQVARRVWPADAGGASLAVSVAPDERLVAAAADLLAGAGFTGLAQLDFVAGPDGPLLIDINPRFYTSLPLALACGVNLAGIWHAVVAGERIAPQDGYRVGATFRWLEADLRAAVNGAPRAFADRGRGRHAGAMWSWRDPVPGPLLFARASRSRVLRMVGRRNEAPP
jgi:predicted ATP-grasp superfamily ATP-dependent carboligase